jgi:hypothetical protein
VAREGGARRRRAGAAREIGVRSMRIDESAMERAVGLERRSRSRSAYRDVTADR